MIPGSVTVPARRAVGSPRRPTRMVRVQIAVSRVEIPHEAPPHRSLGGCTGDMALNGTSSDICRECGAHRTPPRLLITLVECGAEVRWLLGYFRADGSFHALHALASATQLGSSAETPPAMRFERDQVTRWAADCLGDLKVFVTMLHTAPLPTWDIVARQVN